MLTYVYFIFRNEIINKSGFNMERNLFLLSSFFYACCAIYNCIIHVCHLSLCAFLSFLVWQIWKTNLPKFEFFIQKQAMYK